MNSASRSPAAARSPAAWPPRPPTTAPCCCSRARRLGRARAGDRREDARPAGRGGRPGARADRHRPARRWPRRRSWWRRWSRTTTSRPALLAELDAMLGAEAILASTTSSLSVERLAQASGRPDRFLGLHVFNPVTKMQLIELIFPAAASAETRSRALALCEAFEKTPVEVPDVPGLRRQPPAVPLPVQRRAPAGRDGHGPGGRRHLHAARRRAPDGAARAARPGRPGRVRGDRRDDRRADARAGRAS